MLFQKKVDRAMDYAHQSGGHDPEKDQEEREEDIRKEVEKGDTLAMIVSALLVILPVAVVALLLLALFGALPLFLG